MIRLLRLLFVAAVMVLAGLVRPSLFAQAPDDLTTLQREMRTLKDSQMQLRREVLELRTLLLRAVAALPSSPPSTISIANSPIRGVATAPITVVEFSDYQCPYCGQFVAQSYPEIYQHYIATGKVRYVLRDFPLVSIHPLAFQAAEAAHCAGDQGQYWSMHDRMFANQETLARSDLLNHAQGIRLNIAQFEQCLRSDKYADVVRAGLTDGEQASVNGTPTFFIGFTDPESLDQVRPLHVIRGTKPFAEFDLVLKALTVELERRAANR